MMMRRGRMMARRRGRMIMRWSRWMMRRGGEVGWPNATGRKFEDPIFGTWGHWWTQNGPSRGPRMGPAGRADAAFVPQCQA